jgi:catechol 2,3-dioxygenase-like lactoylglutathione lyase family enzyme
MAARFTSAIPKLASMDMQRSVDFYARLGFTGHAVEGAYAIVRRDAVELHFWLSNDPAHAQMTGCRVNVDDVDALYAEYLPHGIVHPNDPLADKPWGLREFSIIDVDGNLLTFASRIVSV